jgi:hypothetical protein
MEIKEERKKKGKEDPDLVISRFKQLGNHGLQRGGSGGCFI